MGLHGLPCKHVICAILKARQHPEDFVSDLFKKPLYVETYAEVIYPVPQEHGWTKTDTPDINPPLFLVHLGRPKKHRGTTKDEKAEPKGKGRMTTITGSNCGKLGHKYTSCSQQLKPELALRKSKNKVQTVFTSFL